jgi:hypothetical protein
VARARPPARAPPSQRPRGRGRSRFQGSAPVLRGQ